MSTVTAAAAAALPQLLRHFVLLSHTHTHTPSLARSHTPPHTHLLTHALSVFSFNPPLSPGLSTAFSPLIPPSFHHLLSAIHPSLSSGFPLSVSVSPCVSLQLLCCQRSCRDTQGDSKPVLNYFSLNSALTCSSQLLRVFPISVSSSTCSGCLF